MVLSSFASTPMHLSRAPLSGAPYFLASSPSKKFLIWAFSAATVESHTMRTSRNGTSGRV